jgi:hypothetical protein
MKKDPSPRAYTGNCLLHRTWDGRQRGESHGRCLRTAVIVVSSRTSQDRERVDDETTDADRIGGIDHAERGILKQRPTDSFAVMRLCHCQPAAMTSRVALQGDFAPKFNRLRPTNAALRRKKPWSMSIRQWLVRRRFRARKERRARPHGWTPRNRPRPIEPKDLRLSTTEKCQ